MFHSICYEYKSIHLPLHCTAIIHSFKIKTLFDNFYLCINIIFVIFLFNHQLSWQIDYFVVLLYWMKKALKYKICDIFQLTNLINMDNSMY